MFLSSIVKHFNLQLALACLLIAVSQFNYGFDAGAFSNTLAMDAFERSFGSYDDHLGRYAIPSYILSMMNSLPYIGFAIGLMVGSLVSARYGRRVTMCVMSVWVIATSTIVITANSVEQLLPGRILHYGYIGMELSVVPVFQSEIVPAPVRGFIVGTYQLALLFGQITIAGVCYSTSTIQSPSAYRIPFGLFYIVPVIVIALIFLIPESPRWLLLQDRIEEARQSHHKYRVGTMEHEQIEAEFQRMHQALLDEPEQGKFKELFQGVNRKRTALIFGMGTFQQITGQAFASQYAAVFIKGLGTINPFAMSLGNSCIASFGIICTLLTVDKIGRRRLLLIGSLIQIAALLSMGSVGSQSPLTFSHKAGIVASLAIFVFGFGVAWGPLTFVVITELPALRLRDQSQRVGALTNIFFNFAVNFTIPYLIGSEYADLGGRVGFIYGGLSVLALLFVYFFVPECKGRSLEEIDRMFHEKVPMRKFGSHPRLLGAEEAEANDDGADLEKVRVKAQTQAVHVE